MECSEAVEEGGSTVEAACSDACQREREHSDSERRPSTERRNCRYYEFGTARELGNVAPPRQPRLDTVT